MKPVIFTWDGDAMQPLGRFKRLCDEQYTVGENYLLVAEGERTQATHNHFFACVHQAWLNLPEGEAERFPSDDHLRRWALIKAGFCDERTIVAGTSQQAQEIAALVDALDSYAVVLVSGRIVAVYTAKSQSKRSMGAQDFQRSKQAVLDILAGMIGASAEDLQRAAA